MPVDTSAPTSAETGRRVQNDAGNVIDVSKEHAGHDIFFAAVQMSGMPMILTDPHVADNPIIFCNRAFEELTGYTQAEVMGRNCRFLQGYDTDPKTLARIRAGLRERRDVHEEIYNYRKDGSGFWNGLFISPVFGAGGELIYFFASQLDVTRRHEAEAMLRQAQRIETLGSVATGVAHEFNNLMTIVMGSLSQLERGIAGGSRDRARVERAMWAAGQAGQLTQQMLSFARRQFHDNRPTDINDAVRNLHGAVRQCAGPAINVTLDLWPGDLWVHLDTAQLEQAVLNLVKNAADAMPAGGALVVRTADVRGADAQGAAMAVLSVQDHGSGMAPDVAQRAPEPFFTTKANGAGTGLGLSMVVGFATQSGGTCRIDTAQGQGTTVSLSFPLLAASPRVP